MNAEWIINAPKKTIELVLTLHRNIALLQRLREANHKTRFEYIKQVFHDNGLDPNSIIKADMHLRQNERYTTEVDFSLTISVKYDEQTNIECFKRILRKLMDSPDICITPTDEGLLEFIPNERFGRNCNVRLISMSFGTIIRNQFIQHSHTISSTDVGNRPIVSFKLDSQRSMELFFLLGDSLYCIELLYHRHVDKRIVVCWDNASTRIYFQLLLAPKVFKAVDGSFQYNQFKQQVSTNISPEAYLSGEDAGINVTWNRATSFPGCLKETLGNCTALELRVSDSSCPKDRLMSFFKELMERQYTITFGQFEASHCNNYTRRWGDMFSYLEKMTHPHTFYVCWALKVVYSKGYVAIDYIENDLFFWTTFKKYVVEDPEQLELALYKIASILDDDRSIDLYTALCDIYKDRSLKKQNQQNQPVTGVKKLYKIRSCYITPTRQIYCPPMVILENRIVREFNSDYCLRVIYRDDDFERIKAKNEDFYEEIIRMHISNPIKVHDREFRLLGCSNSQLRNHGVWFYAKDENKTTPQQVREHLGDFSRIDCIASYVSRMGQCFSTSERSVTSIKDCERIENDVSTPDGEQDYTFSDGTGRVSQTMAEEICKQLTRDFTHIPSLFQIRYGGCKGTVSVDNSIDSSEGKVIVIRKSMDKFECNNRDLEIVKVAETSSLNLNHQSIMLLEHHGIPIEVFLKLQEAEIDELIEMLLNDNTAARILDSRASMGRHLSHKALLASGLSLTTEPYFRRVIKLILHNSLRRIKLDGRLEIPTDMGRNLMGCMDEYAVLEYGEIHVKISSMPTHRQGVKRTIVGPVIVTKFPAVHPGDMRRFVAVEKPELAHLVDCVVFPQKGHRPHPSEMAGSDLDGDEYFVTWLPEFIRSFSLENVQPLDYKPVKKMCLGRTIVLSDIYQFISDYIKNDQLGSIANAHKAVADNNGLDDEIAVKLANKFSEAVDFAKTGTCPVLDKEEQVTEYPDFMEKYGIAEVYESKNALGLMYRDVCLLDDLLEQSIDTKDEGVNWNPINKFVKSYNDRTLFREQVENAKFLYNEYCTSVREMMQLYGVETETEIISGNITRFHRRFMEKDDMFATSQIVRERVVKLRSDYRTKFFEEFKVNPKETTTYNITDGMKIKACAWHYVAYTLIREEDITDSTDRILSFAWLVMDILCNIHGSKITELTSRTPLIAQISQSILNMYNRYVELSRYQIREHTDEALQWFVDMYPAIYPLLFILEEWCDVANLKDMFLSMVEIILKQLDLPGLEITKNLIDNIKHYRDYRQECNSGEIGVKSIGKVFLDFMRNVGSQTFLIQRVAITDIKPIKDMKKRNIMRIHAMRARFSLAVDSTCKGLLNMESFMKKKRCIMKEATVVIPNKHLSYILETEVKKQIIMNFERLADLMKLNLREISISSRKKGKKKKGTIFFRGSHKTTHILKIVTLKWFKKFEKVGDDDYYNVLYNIYKGIKY